MSNELPAAVDHSIAEAFDRETREYVRLRAKAEEAELEAKRRKADYERQKERLWDFLEAAGLKTTNHELGRFTRGTNVRGVVKDRDALRQDLEDRGLLSAFTKVDFRQRELNKLVKDSIEDGEELPEGVEPLVMKVITYTSKKPAADAMRAVTR